MGLGAAELSFTVLDPSKVPAGHYPRWAVLGRSNVGKSSFLNALVHPSSPFRTGRTPGVTTGLIGVKVRMSRAEESILELVDLPGFGYARGRDADRDRWSILADALREQSMDTGLLWVWLLDPLREPQNEEHQLLSWLNNAPFAALFTKADQVKNSQRAKVLKAWAPFVEAATEGPYWVSSLKGEGMQEIFKSARNFVRGVHENRKNF
jgi:GTP-binding protein